MTTNKQWAATHRIKAKFGVWDCTHYPLGGKFFRPDTDLPVTTEGAPIKTSYGYVTKLIAQDGRIFYAQEQSFAPLD